MNLKDPIELARSNLLDYIVQESPLLYLVQASTDYLKWTGTSPDMSSSSLQNDYANHEYKIYKKKTPVDEHEYLYLFIANSVHFRVKEFL